MANNTTPLWGVNELREEFKEVLHEVIYEGLIALCDDIYNLEWCNSLK